MGHCLSISDPRGLYEAGEPNALDARLPPRGDAVDRLVPPVVKST
jgi:hypothetical protein